MPRSRKRSLLPAPDSTSAELPRLARPLSLAAQVEQLLRQAIAEGRFPSGRLPTEVELAEQLGVSRETVRLAAEVLQREGLLVKIRRRGTFIRLPRLPGQAQAAPSTLLGYLQADYPAPHGQEEAVTRAISGLMLQGANEEAGRAGFELVVRHAPHLRLREAFQQLYQNVRLRGVIFASYGEEKLLRRVLGLGLPTLLLDHDLRLPQINSVRDDSFEGARQAVRYLASLGHRRIAFVHWRQTELNPWRLSGYRQGLRDVGLRRRDRWEVPVELTEAGARQAVEQVLTLAPQPTALYCFNNTLAGLVIAELQRRGVRVPQDMSVMGGGGEEVPGLTCHQADWHQLGRTAVQVLLRAIADPEGHTPEHLLSPHALRIGRTTAPRPAV
ncbi:MAG TPA: GntR family transcriptional regulator [Gemmataceae bacterium]|nr:GntR family transcriptional regulator [Gemmataceae bacterium]